jgi:ABC-2 type transport system permease protein
MVAKLKTYWYYWIKSSQMTLQALLATRLASFFFIIGKFGRFFLFIWFLLVIKDKIQHVAGYSIDQLILFFLIFNFFDLFGQLFYRGIYWFRSEIVSGTFDFRLVKPISPLFQILTRHTDFLDIPLLTLVIIGLIIKFPTTHPYDLLIFFILSLSAIIIITAIHIAVASIGVITTEVDHTIWVFRDLASMARVPIDIYVEFIRTFLTYIIPIALVYTFPAKALYRLLSPLTIVATLIGALVFYFLSLLFWRHALTKYSSASS